MVSKFAQSLRSVLIEHLLATPEQSTEAAASGASTAAALQLAVGVAGARVGNVVARPPVARSRVADGVVADALGAEHMCAPPVVSAHVGVDRLGRVDHAALGDGLPAAVATIGMAIVGGTTKGAVEVAIVVDATATTTVLVRITVSTGDTGRPLGAVQGQLAVVRCRDADVLALGGRSIRFLALSRAATRHFTIISRRMVFWRSPVSFLAILSWFLVFFWTLQRHWLRTFLAVAIWTLRLFFAAVRFALAWFSALFLLFTRLLAACQLPCL